MKQIQMRRQAHYKTPISFSNIWGPIILVSNFLHYPDSDFEEITFPSLFWVTRFYSTLDSTLETILLHWPFKNYPDEEKSKLAKSSLESKTLGIVIFLSHYTTEVTMQTQNSIK